MKQILKLRRLWLLLTFPAAFLLTALAAGNEGFAEGYANTVYPVLSRFGNRLTGMTLSFSFGEFFVYALLLFFAAALVRFLARLIREKENRALTAGKFFVNLLCAAGVLFFLFTGNCGINYYRTPFAQTCGLKVKASSKEELAKLCTVLAKSSNDLRAEVKTNPQTVMQLDSRQFSANSEKARSAFDRLSGTYPLLRSGYSGPKPVLASKMMSRCNITGMFFPFTFEANVNTDVPEYTIPFTMCHELSHLRGYMREDEANFIAYLACSQSTDMDFRYSGSVMAFTYASNALFSADGDTAGSIFSTLSEGVRRDLQFNNDYWNSFKGPAADAANSVNNSYLKANNQQDGVQSYGRMVDLLLALQRAGKLAKD